MKEVVYVLEGCNCVFALPGGRHKSRSDMRVVAFTHLRPAVSPDPIFIIYSSAARERERERRERERERERERRERETGRERGGGEERGGEREREREREREKDSHTWKNLTNRQITLILNRIVHNNEHSRHKYTPGRFDVDIDTSHACLSITSVSPNQRYVYTSRFHGVLGRKPKKIKID